MSVRSRLLQRAFNLLYGPFVFLHEPAGICLFGAAWHGRRIATLDLFYYKSRLLDLGCGRGQLLRELRNRGLPAVGIDSSARMLKHGSQQRLNVVRASAAALPVPDESFSSIVCTYPGSWIREPAVWVEIERVLSPGGQILILLGGNVSRGRGGNVRALLGRLTYGAGDNQAIEFEPPLVENSRIAGQLDVLDDEWGTVVRWIGSSSAT